MSGKQGSGHPSDAIFQVLKSSLWLPSNKSQREFSCSSCLVSKAYHLPVSHQTSFSTDLLELVQCDVWTSLVSFVTDFTYYIQFDVDDYTQFTWLYQSGTNLKNSLVL